MSALLIFLAQFALANTGELHLRVVDPAGLPVQSSVELTSSANEVRGTYRTDEAGEVSARRLPLGSYVLTVTSDGFAPYATVIELASAQPMERRVTLALAGVQAQVTVQGDDTLIDRRGVAAVQHLGADTLQRRSMALPGRALPELVTTQPGWLLEANGILHPRGSEYQVQYVVDGLPLTDNRSPAFAPELGADDINALRILTAGYPAEYGRKLGGVIEVVTGGDIRRGLHGAASAVAGSFDTGSGDVMTGYGWARTRASISAGLATTDRYLDAPVEENYTNHGTTAHAAVRFEHDFSDADRAGVIVRTGRAEFEVPNERVQQLAGQRQRRTADEAAGLLSYQRLFSADATGDLRGMVRRLAATLESNAASTPIVAAQDRGFTEFYLKGAVAGRIGRHEWKAGGDFGTAQVRELFSYDIVDTTAFEAGTPDAFAFEGRRRLYEGAVFAQDQLRFGAVTVSAGLRWDRYRFLADGDAISPRLGLAWSVPRAGLVLRAAYDRAFQTPAVENLLLASSRDVESLGDGLVQLPVPASRGNFYEAGVSKALFGGLRVDVSYYRRSLDNLADDDVLLNTGVSFPIAFAHALVTGTEVKLDLPLWRSLAASLSYSRMRGTGEFPVTGGLFLGEEAAELLEESEDFPLSQDQRHSLHGGISYNVTRSAWVALTGSYGSGLPFEDFEGDADDAEEQYGARIVDRVDFATGRVRARRSLDASAGVSFRSDKPGRLTLQADVRNLTNRFDVINFAGVFSGTAVAPPRSIAVRLRVAF